MARRTRSSKPARPATPRHYWNVPWRIMDRYLSREIVSVTFLSILGFTLLIIGNNFYANAEFIFSEEYQIPIWVVAQLSLMEAPASIVVSLPIATTMGVMLAIGRLGRDSELIAIRAGGVSLTRIVLPVLATGLALSVINYHLAERWVPAVGSQAETLRKTYVKKQFDLNLNRDVFFRDPEGRIIYAATYNTKDYRVQRPVVIEREKRDASTPTDDLLHFYTASSGSFNAKDELVPDAYIPQKHQVFEWREELQGWELLYKEEVQDENQFVKFHLAKDLREIADKPKNPANLAADDLAGVERRMREAGRNTSKEQTDLAVKQATPVACAIFAYVAFIFGIVNPRREKFTGAFYALVVIFWYYVANAIFKNLGYNGLVRPPEVAAWATNVIFFVMATVLFMRMR